MEMWPFCGENFADNMWAVPFTHNLHENSSPHTHTHHTPHTLTHTHTHTHTHTPGGCGAGHGKRQGGSGQFSGDWERSGTLSCAHQKIWWLSKGSFLVVYMYIHVHVSSTTYVYIIWVFYMCLLCT